MADSRSDAAQLALLGAIKAYFENFDEKARFTRKLFYDGHTDEGLTLCCEYIEALGNKLFWPRSAPRERNFVDVLVAHSEEPTFGLVHLRSVLDKLSVKSATQRIRLALADVLVSSERQLRTDDEMIDAVRGALDSSDLDRLRHNLWRGSLAAVAYQELRCSFTHQAGGPKFLEFGGCTHRGSPIPRIDFDLLYSSLLRVLAFARQRSVEVGEFFGHKE